MTTRRAVPTDLERLRRFLFSPGPAHGFAIARYKDPRVRDQILTNLEHEAETCHVAFERIGVTQSDLGLKEPRLHLPDHIAQRIADMPQDQARAVAVVGLEWFLIDPLGKPRVSPSIGTLNVSRDSLPKRWPARVVFWFSDAAANSFADNAYDTYDVALTHFRFDDQLAATPIPSRFADVPQWMMAAKDEDVPRLKREIAFLETLFDQEKKPGIQAEHADRIGQIHAVISDAGIAPAWFTKAIALYQTANDAYGETRSRLRLGNFLFARGEMREALEQFETVQVLAEKQNDEAMVAKSQGYIADVLEIRGDLDTALEIREKQTLPVYQKLGDMREEAVTRGRIADILQARSALDAALEIREKHELPVYQKLGDARGEAVTQGKIADILQARGDLDTALEIREKHELPVYQKLGDVRSEAITRGKITDILQARGELDAALETLQNQVLIAFRKLGDVRSEAITRGKIAAILVTRGEFDAALKIFQNQVLPAFQKLGDVRSEAVAKGKIADILQARGDLDAALEIREKQTLPMFQKLGDVREEAVTRGQIADILWLQHKQAQAIEMYRHDILPMYQTLGDKRSLLVGQTNLAQMLLQRGNPEDQSEALGLLRQALRAAQEMQIPEAEQISQLLHARLGDNP